jgi:hypothetical protein
MGREATLAGSRNQLFLPAVWLVVTMLLLVIFQSVGVPRALGDDGGPTEATASDYPLVAADPTEQAAPSALHAGVMWSLSDVRITPTDELLGRARIEVDVSLTNTLATASLRVSDRLVSLQRADGNDISNGVFQGAGTRVALEPGEVKDITIVFTTGYSQNPDPADLTLQIAEPSRVPASIPLAGPGAEGQGPIFMAVDARADTLPDPDNTDRQIVVEPQAATLDVNAGPYRAAVGEKLALVKVFVQRTTASESSGYLDTSFWALEADDAELAPLVVTRTAQPASNADEVTLLFAFAEGTDDLALQAGLGGSEIVSFSLVTPGS